jgi:hypothetical protein
MTHGPTMMRHFINYEESHSVAAMHNLAEDIDLSSDSGRLYLVPSCTISRKPFGYLKKQCFRPSALGYWNRFPTRMFLAGSKTTCCRLCSPGLQGRQGPQSGTGTRVSPGACFDASASLQRNVYKYDLDQAM